MRKISLAFLSIAFLLVLSHQQCLPGCTSCSTPYNCNTCQQNQTCCASTCTSCVNQTQCMGCASGYLLNSSSNLCYLSNSCSQSTCNSCSGSTCSSCVQGNYLNQYTYQCISCPPSCLSCTGSDNCLSCIPGFNLVVNSCVNCAATIENCATCATSQNSALICLTCSAGFYLSQPAQCIACGQNCLQCNSTNCLSCQVGFYLNSGSCQQCSQFGCTSCPNAVCSQCILGTFLNPSTNTCELCIQGCQVCSSLSFCLSCSDNFFMQYGLCKHCQFECDQCSGNAYNCLSCQLGFYQPNGYGYCLPCPEYCPNCTNSQQTNAIVCLSCPYGTYLSASGACLNCTVPNCLSCGSSICNLCNAGYFLNNGKCTPCLSNCQVCTNTTNCQACQLNYYLQGDNTCTACSANCAICTPSGCNQCAIGFYNNNGVCSACPSNCFGCTSNNYCTSCILGYFLGQTGQCSLCSQKCRTCYLSSEICTSCHVGYYLDFSTLTCSICAPGCLVCDEDQGCLICNGTYSRVLNAVSSQYQCQSCPQNCLNCTSIQNTTICSQCVFGFTKTTNGSCFACGSTNITYGCAVCYPNMSCEICQSGLVLSSSNICQAQIVDQSNDNGFYIVLIVVISAACVGLFGLVIYNQYKKKTENQGLYNQIA